MTSAAETATNAAVEAEKLSYNDLAVDGSGAVLTKEQKMQLRGKHGFCQSCTDIPVKLFDMKRSRFNPLWFTKVPRSVPLECNDGVCFKCAAVASAKKRNPSVLPRTSYHRASIRSFDTRTTSTTNPNNGSSINSSINNNNTLMMDPMSIHSSNTNPARAQLLPIPNNLGRSNSSKDLDHRSTHSTGSSHHSHHQHQHHSNANPNGNPNSNPHLARQTSQDSAPITPIRRQSSHKQPSPGGGGTSGGGANGGGVDQPPVSPRRMSSNRNLSRSRLVTNRPQLHTHSEDQNSNNVGDYVPNPPTPVTRTASGSMPLPSSSAHNNNNGNNHNHNHHHQQLNNNNHGISLQRANSVRSRMVIRQCSTRSNISTLSDNTAHYNGGALLEEQQQQLMTMERDNSVRSFDFGVLSEDQEHPDNLLLAEEDDDDDEDYKNEESFSNFHHQQHAHHHSSSGGLSFGAEEAQAAAFEQCHKNNNHSKDPPQDLKNNANALVSASATTITESSSTSANTSTSTTADDMAPLVNDLIAAKSLDVLADVVVNAMAGDMGNEKVQEYSLSVLAKQFGGEGAATHLMQVEAPKIVVQAMTAHETNPRIQEFGCEVASLLLSGDRHLEAAHAVWVREGLTTRLSKILMGHMESASVVTKAIATVRSLSVDLEARNLFASLSLSKQIVQVMQFHVNVQDIQRDGCAIISNMAVDLERKQVFAVDKETIECIVTSIRNHSSDQAVLASAVFALKNLTYDEGNLSTLCRIQNVGLVLGGVQNCNSPDASVVFDRVQVRQTEDLSLEDSALESLTAHVQLKQDDQRLVLDILDVCKMYHWSLRVVLACFQEISARVEASREQQKVLKDEPGAISQLRVHLASFQGDKSVCRAAEAIFAACEA